MNFFEKLTRIWKILFQNQAISLTQQTQQYADEAGMAMNKAIQNAHAAGFAEGQKELIQTLYDLGWELPDLISSAAEEKNKANDDITTLQAEANLHKKTAEDVNKRVSQARLVKSNRERGINKANALREKMK